jgi:hypothetical protein
VNIDKLSEMLRPSVRDDRGCVVRCFRAEVISQKQSGLMRAVRAALTCLVFFIACVLLAWMLLSLVTLVLQHVGLGVRVAGPGWVGVGTVVMILLSAYGMPGSRERRVRDRCEAMLQQSRCGACGYDLAKLVPAEDGCVVCAECGAAWKPLAWWQVVGGRSATSSSPTLPLPP